jgi:hypothetical protein
VGGWVLANFSVHWDRFSNRVSSLGVKIAPPSRRPYPGLIAGVLGTWCRCKVRRFGETSEQLGPGYCSGGRTGGVVCLCPRKFEGPKRSLYQETESFDRTGRRNSVRLFFLEAYRAPEALHPPYYQGT